MQSAFTFMATFIINRGKNINASNVCSFYVATGGSKLPFWGVWRPSEKYYCCRAMFVHCDFLITFHRICCVNVQRNQSSREPQHRWWRADTADGEGARDDDNVWRGGRPEVRTSVSLRFVNWHRKYSKLQRSTFIYYKAVRVWFLQAIKGSQPLSFIDVRSAVRSPCGIVLYPQLFGIRFSVRQSLIRDN